MLCQLPTYHNLPDNAVVCLMSPTASGKTDLACQLYQTGRFELISVDSALIYQGMNIGTAKPTADELREFPHHLVDIIRPTDSYSVANFVHDVERLIGQIHAKGKIPLLVGGTMMYYMALLDGISSVPQTVQSVRQKVQQWLHEQGNAALYEYLLQHDPIICQKLKITDTQRITRAVEVHLQTAQPMSYWQTLPKIALSDNPQWRWYGIIVNPDRAWLHERIERRLQLMWAAGFVDEVVQLLISYPDLTAEMPAMRAVGYRQVLDYLVAIHHECVVNHHGLQPYYLLKQSAISPQNISNNHHFDKKMQKTTTNTEAVACQDMKNKALYATRQLAKRQYTWLRQLALIDKATTTNLTIASFDSIQQVQQQFMQY
ncbi:tRNA dimethylallyltransferase [Moraxella cuniculi DSM 21768]|uniref:tRNA dimethylallyltransferase n=1 Tax=Moraxella cuniculi DSM 21768 TaxID=1122245 RepID=A0A1N7FJ93_9GAMM|nr:tRNA (adenosine(37)-N6)-dimethylallyltransferase MiaA [Moraxella cuniculi]OOS02234.1 tRNA (adenosine(37)-N6)-dimethylallyltransferase MiaA [Moraxella cuniculi]SIS00488.1 tRNA dimethylallyltransferase [Moraxella cuniculi DSM 21768]